MALATRTSLLTTALIATLSLFSTGCTGTNFIAIDGYPVESLAEKRLYILLPGESGYTMKEKSAFALSRGIGELGAIPRLASEFSSNLASELDALYTVNTVFDYGSQPVGSIHELFSDRDFTSNPQSWDWVSIDAARKRGAIDFLIVISNVVVDNDLPTGDADRGEERVELLVRLIDVEKRTELVRDVVSVSVDDPRVPRDTYIALSREIAGILPFVNNPE